MSETPSKRSYAKLEDTRLVLLAQGGDREAFGQLYRRYKNWVIRIAYLTGTDLGAADVSQSCWIKVYRHIGSLREPAHFKRWLRSIVRHHCFDKIRYKRAKNEVVQNLRRPLSLDAPGHEKNMDEDTRTIANLIESNDNREIPEQLEVTRAIEESIQTLSESFRQTAVLWFVEDRSYEEICQITGVPIGTVRSRLNRARTAMQLSLKARIPEQLSEIGVDTKTKAPAPS